MFSLAYMYNGLKVLGGGAGVDGVVANMILVSPQYQLDLDFSNWETFMGRTLLRALKNPTN